MKLSRHLSILSTLGLGALVGTVITASHPPKAFAQTRITLDSLQAQINAQSTQIAALQSQVTSLQAQVAACLTTSDADARYLRLTGGTLSGNLLVTGGVTAGGVFSGDGGGLTGIPLASTTGTLPDARLSTNVPLLNANNTFAGQNRFQNFIVLGQTSSPAQPSNAGAIFYNPFTGQIFYSNGINWLPL